MRPAQGQARARRPEGPEGCRADDAVGREATGEQHRARGKGQGAGQPTDRAEGEGRKADRDRRPAAPECAPAPGPDTRRWGEPPGHPKGGEQVSEASAPSRRRPSADAVVGGEAPRVEGRKARRRAPSPACRTRREAQPTEGKRKVAGAASSRARSGEAAPRPPREARPPGASWSAQRRSREVPFAPSSRAAAVAPPNDTGIPAREPGGCCLHTVNINRPVRRVLASQQRPAPSRTRLPRRRRGRALRHQSGWRRSVGEGRRVCGRKTVQICLATWV